MLFCSTLLTVVGGYDRMKVPFGESIGIYQGVEFRLI